MTRSPSAGSISRSFAFSTRAARADERPQLVHDVRRAPRSATGPRTASSRARRPGSRARSPPPPGSRASGRDRSRGCIGRLKSWNRWRAHRAAAPRRPCPRHSLPDEDRRRVVGPDDEHRLLEPRVEPGEERDVRAVLAVRVDDEAVERARVRARAQRGDALGVRARPGSRAAGRASRSRAGRSSPAARSPSSSPPHRARRASTARPRRRPRSMTHEPVAGDAHATAPPRRRARSPAPRPRVAGPSPTCVQPSWPPMCPPPTTTSRRPMTVSPTRTSTSAPIASRLPPGCAQPQPEPVAHRRGRAGGARADVAPHAHRRAEVDLDEVQAGRRG